MVTAVGNDKYRPFRLQPAAFRGSAKYRGIHSNFEVLLHLFNPNIFLIKILINCND